MDLPDEMLSVVNGLRDQSLSIDEIIASARPAEAIVRLCLRGDLNAEIGRLEVELAESRERARRGTDDEQALGGDDGTDRDVVLAERIEELRAEMGRHLHTFTVRAMPSEGPKSFGALDKKHNPTGMKRDVEAMAPELIAASCVSPAMTPAQVTSLFGVLNAGQRDQLFNGAWSVNTGSVDIPKSPLSLAVLRRLGSSGN